MGIYASSHELVDAELKEYFNQLDVEKANAVLEVYHRTIVRQTKNEEQLSKKPWTAERAVALEEIRKENLQTRQEADYVSNHYRNLLKQQG